MTNYDDFDQALIAMDRLIAARRKELVERLEAWRAEVRSKLDVPMETATHKGKRLNKRVRSKPDVAMEIATHKGKRLNTRGLCEKCGTPTNWVVDLRGRVGAYWCGCGN